MDRSTLFFMAISPHCFLLLVHWATVVRTAGSLGCRGSHSSDLSSTHSVPKYKSSQIFHCGAHTDVYRCILCVDSLIFLRMWSIVKSLQRHIFRNGGSSIVLVYTASFFAPSYYSDMWESQHPGRRVMHQIRAQNGRGASPRSERQ